MDGSLAIAGLFAVPVGLVYAWIGRRFHGRAVSREAETAITAFTTWWYGLAGFTLLEGAQTLLAAAGVGPLNLFVGLAFLETLVLVAALWGLVVYLAYVWLGPSPWSVAAAAGGYLGCFLVISYLISMARPTGLEVGVWTVGLAYAAPPTPLAEALLGALLTAPPVLGALAYLSLVPRVDDPTRRYRIVAVSAGVLVVFGGPLAGTLTGLEALAVWPLAVRGLGLLGALLMLAAYAPPRPVREMWGIQGLARPAPGGGAESGVGS